MNPKISKRGGRRNGTAPQSRPDQATAVSDLEKRMEDEARPDYGPVRSDMGGVRPAGEEPDMPLEEYPGGPQSQPSAEQDAVRSIGRRPGKSIPVVDQETPDDQRRRGG